MNTSIKTLFVAGVHGNEPIPVDVLSSMHVPFIVGNPKALAKHTRYVDEDLNRVFGKQGTTYERIRAQKILQEILEDAYVVDFHTASSLTMPFAIITEIELIPLASWVGIEHVILFPRSGDRICNSLIHKRKGIVIECGSHTDTVGVRDVIAKVVYNCVHRVRHAVKIYEVVKKNTDGSMGDFTQTDEGLYRVLTGAKNHKGGYLARLT